MKSATPYLLILLLIGCSKSVTPPETPPPNIIFFISDDISQEDIGCYGHPIIQTPHIDRLALHGMRFDNAYLTTSSCSPSRCSIITGRYPHNTGAPELHALLPESQIRFPELLKDAGYFTVLSGKNHMFKNPDRAFNQITKGGGSGGSDDWVAHVRNRPLDQPFFFWLASRDAHRGWQQTEHAPVYNTDDIIVPPYMADTKITREDLAHYYHEVSRFDYYIGAVVAELERQGILENTLIVVASDNGRPFPRDKSRLYDSGIKTPWVVHYPQLIRSASVTKSLISSIDLSATCLELAGLEQPEFVQGQSFVPILKDPTAVVRELAFAEQNWHVYSDHSRMVRFGDFTYIKNNTPEQPNGALESEPHFPAGKELWQAHVAGKTTPTQQQLFVDPGPSEELFRLSTDPHQLTNLADDPDSKNYLELGRQLIARWTQQTGDTIPENPTPHRHEPARIINGKVIPNGTSSYSDSVHLEMPGDATNASSINHPGPLSFESKITD